MCGSVQVASSGKTREWGGYKWLTYLLFLLLCWYAVRSEPVIQCNTRILSDTVQGNQWELVRKKSVTEQAERFGVSPTLALAVSQTENYSGDPQVINKVGAVGIMQVKVDQWFGVWHEECRGSDLLDPTINACYGVLILKTYLQQCNGKVECALRHYVRGPRGTANVDGYVQQVLRTQGRME